MANAGYPDDDGSRTPAGQHDLGRQRVSMRDVCATTMPAVVGEMAAHGDRINGQSTSGGDTFLAAPCYPVDGDAGAGGRYTPADYPAGVPGSTA